MIINYNGGLIFLGLTGIYNGKMGAMRKSEMLKEKNYPKRIGFGRHKAILPCMHQKPGATFSFLRQ